MNNSVRNFFTFPSLKKFFLVNLGVFVVCIGLHYFLIPSDLAVGGASGFAMLMASIFQKFSVSTTLLFVNTILIILGILTIGKSFGAYTIYASIAMSGFLKIMEVTTPMPKPFIDDLILNLIYGIFIQGIGIGLVLNRGASTGGTDIVAKIIEKYTNFSFGSGLAFTDGVITLGATIIYGPEKGMYALLGVILNSVIIDKMLAGFDSKFNVTIVSDKLNVINKYILVDLYRGSTIYLAQGGYSEKEKKILTTILDRRDYIKLRQFIKKTDEDAFVYISKISEVEGRGFTFEQKPY